jgi:hypothetical protein
MTVNLKVGVSIHEISRNCKSKAKIAVKKFISIYATREKNFPFSHMVWMLVARFQVSSSSHGLELHEKLVRRSIISIETGSFYHPEREKKFPSSHFAWTRSFYSAHHRCCSFVFFFLLLKTFFWYIKLVICWFVTCLITIKRSVGFWSIWYKFYFTWEFAGNFRRETTISNPTQDQIFFPPKLFW